MKRILTLRQTGSFCQNPRFAELEDERILCNDVTFAHERHPHNMRLWAIGNVFGCVAAVWADCEQDALDEMVDAGLGDCFLVDEANQQSATEQEREEWAHLGNAGEPCDLSDAWIGEVEFDAKRDLALMLSLAEARGANQTTLDQ